MYIYIYVCVCVCVCVCPLRYFAEVSEQLVATIAHKKAGDLRKT